ncbi:MAG: hypothetical protein QM786_04030 [Breznakibacter sp.]
MEKEALLSIILHDLKEIEVLVQTFSGKSQILPPFVKLAIQKIDNIRQELELLEALPNETVTSAQPRIEVSPSIEKAQIQPLPNKRDGLEALQTSNVTFPVEPEIPKVDEATKPVGTTLPDKFEIEADIPVTSPIAERPAPVVVPEIKEEPVLTPPQPVAKAEEPSVLPEPAPKPENPSPSAPQEPKVQKQATTLGETLATDKGSVLEQNPCGKGCFEPGADR